MNRHGKRLLALLMCVITVMSMLPASAMAAKVIGEGYCGTEDVWWTLTDDGVFTVSGKGDMIGCGWFGLMEKIKTVVIEDGVTAICGSAFSGCTNLTNVRIANSVTFIGMSAFQGCTSLKSITLPGRVTYIGNGTFSGCSSLTDISIPNSVTHIDGNAFARCDSLASITIPDSVTYLGDSAFYACPSLKSIKLSDNLATIGNYAFQGCTSLEKVAIPKSVISIGDMAFYYCPALTDVTIQNGVESIGEYAFSSCDSLKSVTLPDSVETVGSGAFSGCDNLETIKISKSLTSIEDYTFQSCVSLKDITIPDSVKSIGSNAFDNCTSLENITLPGGVTSIGDYAFVVCTSLTSVSLPEGLTTIPQNAFFGCSALRDVSIPQRVTSIGSYAFYGCTSIAELMIPKNVKTIGENAFNNAIGSVTFSGDAPRIEGKLFTNDNSYFTYNGVIAYYPANNPTWTESVRKSFGDDLIWIPDNYNTSTSDSPKDRTEALTPVSSTNKFSHNYNLNTHLTEMTTSYRDDNPWTDQTGSYLTENADGSYTRVEYTGENIVVEEYDASYKLRWKKTIAKELPVWGGFYSGSEYNFFVFGQENLDENNSKPVVRIVRYSKNWHRIDSTELCGANTIRPFHAGTLRMTEKDDTLYIHTCHQMYTADDGLNHQANLFIALSIPYMKIVTANYHVGGVGYVSHTFNQFVITDDNYIVRLDHGDASPRAVTISRFTGSGANSEKKDILQIRPTPAGIHYNYTGVSVGGFEASDTCYIAVGNSVAMNGGYDVFGVRNIFVSATDKSRFAEADSTKQTWITSYRPSDGITVSNPLFTKISGNRFLLMWAETDTKLNSVTKYMYLDGNGNPTSEIYENNYPLSDCQPIVSDGKVIWYVTENSAPKFYSINLDGTTSYQKGDVNRDGTVSNSDLILVARHVVNLITLTGEQFTLGDMNNDGAVTNTDIITVARMIVGLN